MKKTIYPTPCKDEFFTYSINVLYIVKNIDRIDTDKDSTQSFKKFGSILSLTLPHYEKL